MVRKVTQSFCRNRCQWRNDQIKQLQSQRNDIFRRYSDNSTCLNILLPEVENKLAKLQTEIAEIDILRAGKRWIENNEKSAGYLKRTAESRNIKRNITKLVHPETGLECLDIKAKLDAASNFYSTLYSAEPIDHHDLESMLNTIDKQVSPSDAKHIIRSISFDDILDGSRRTPHKSSPVMDGLPYEILHLIIGHPSCKSLVLEVYNDAINKALFPKSWQQTCLVLLPKTGDLTSLSNWRPISLINTDCKAFTRIMNSRIMGISSKLITRFQSGFMHNRFIGDHGFACRLIMENASKSSPISESLGVILDQTKAYDRIHPEYLCKVLNRFGFPNKFIKCIHELFFGNSISVNVNGSLSDSIQQLRGLRQGDSISPIFFNLAIEPFLLSILHNEIIDGYCLKARRFNSDLQLTAPRSVKLLAYADNILIFINSKEELLEL
ncbi:hypothetical protein RO3G_13902 [Rhizopus delemar RA 99-880]|uniref:Reverse transcriptase domain-containing protein n=3 Tax=Rhizopus TaxID=4842 RepID=I1CL61_RHIO9|nr:hypothetical protein RO3G_13902 [Rhizopus delemar RA 99-880]|eukprot:EIE89191.1 hypothetical protein RO3G_13902 [Rhizopus delemar RA 99-880]